MLLLYNVKYSSSLLNPLHYHFDFQIDNDPPPFAVNIYIC
jgi:hypothetical protein